MNEEIEAEIAKMNLTPDHLTDSKNEGVDEAIPIHIRKERTKKAYKVTMIQDIETIDSYENRTKFNITHWRPIYEVIYEAYIKESNILPDDFIRECKMNSNEPRFISGDIKIILSEWQWEKVYMHKLSSFGVRTCYLLHHIKIKPKINLSFRVNMKDHKYGLILI